MGGDRDGNPHVTPTVTRETLRRHRQEADRGLRETLVGLFAVVSQHRRLMPDGLTGVAEDVEEPFRARVEGMVRALREDPAFEPAQGLAALSSSLSAAGQARTKTLLRPAQVQALVLGRHLARLDIREHSARIGEAVAFLFAQIGMRDHRALDEAGRRERLCAELTTSRPMLGGRHHGGRDLPDDVAAVLGPYFVLRD